MSADSTTQDESSPLLPPSSPSLQTQATSTESAMTSSAIFWKVAAISGATAVGFGAFGAHGLKKRIADPAKLASWGTAAQYQLIHSVALLMASGNPVAASLFTAGMTMFSGSIYALTLNPEKFKFLGPVTPIGGVCLIAGWLVLAFGKRGGPPKFPRF
ncbi:hypothetical protein QBC36DRAFT_333575 [Triangularia setosa]|uniref:DUF423-domain-containing protein n=1 Tax=Triangularia setosa TaxID=2587417 RepID=A0AAN7A5W2_9PEZI|nr:hypothetical protein QBC36DRAFT_333575 [Podospora setosa]